MNRRELLAGLGVASASTLLWATGCGRRPRTARPAPEVEVSSEVRTWLRDAIARLAAVYPAVHALAVIRRRTTAAVDVLGMGVARGRRDAVVLAVRDRDGSRREQVSSDLSRAGVAAAVRALVGGSTRRASFDLGRPPPTPPPPRPLGDGELRNLVHAIERNDRAINSRIVYAASLIDIEDATVWSIAPGHDREQRLVRIRKGVTRAAWNGTRPVVSQAERAWIGGIDDHALDEDAVTGATRDALELMTPGAFEDREHEVVLDPSVTAGLIDAGTRALLTTAAAHRPEVRRRLVVGAAVGPALLTLIDDPTARGAYGGFQFDDEGEPAAPITLVDAGRVAAVLADHAGGGRGRGRRPGHVGPVEPAASHLRLGRGSASPESLRGDGMILEGGLGAVIDPSTTRIVIGASRARETRGGKPTGRVFADVELVGELGPLLAAVTGVSDAGAVTAYRDDAAGEPRWRSIDAPYLRTTGFVRARRRRS